MEKVKNRWQRKSLESEGLRLERWLEHITGVRVARSDHRSCERERAKAKGPKKSGAHSRASGGWRVL